MTTSRSKHIETITEADEEDEPEGDIAKERTDSNLRKGLEKWQRAMEETENDVDQEHIRYLSDNQLINILIYSIPRYIDILPPSNA
jgi:hypothetical protein